MAGRINIKNYKRIKSFLKRNGVVASYYKVLERLLRDEDEKNYTQKVLSMQITKDEAVRQRKTEFENPYLISVLVPVYKPDEDIFIKMLESVAMQTYTNWELCIADAGENTKIYGLVQDFIGRHELDANGAHKSVDFRQRVKYKHIDKNRGISINLNEALKMSSGQYVTFLDHDDVITEDALFEIISVLNNKSGLVKKSGKEKIKFIYSDEDKVSYDDLVYFDHHRKTDFDRAMLLTNNYICHLNVVEASLAKEVGGFDPAYDGSQDFDFALKCTQNLNDDEIVHVPKVLYHWRSSKKSTAENPDAKLYAYEAGKNAVKSHLGRLGIVAEVKNTAHLGFFEIDFSDCKGSIRKMTARDFESLNEAAFDAINEDYIFVLSEDLNPAIEDIESIMKGPMNLPYAGAVCGKILNGREIESAGFMLDKNGGLMPSCQGLNEHFSGYMHRASILRSVDAYDKGCVMLKKSAFKWNFDGPVLAEGYICIYEPRAVFRRK